jgi:hypothetical protein
MELLTRSRAIDSRTERHELPEGLVVNDMMRAVGWDLALRDYTVVLIEGREVPKEAWEVYAPPVGSRVMIALRPSGGRMGGGGSGKSVIMAVASIAIMVVAAVVAPYLAVGLGFVAGTTGYTVAVGAITAGIALGGSLALSAFIKPPAMSNRALTQNAPGGSGPSEGSLYGVTGSQNRAAPYGVVPRIFGRVRVSPYLAAEPFVVSSGPTQTLRLLLDFGYGPLLIEDVRIGTTPISQFPTARYNVHTFYKKGDPLTIYTNDQSSLSVAASLTQGVDNIRRAPQDCNAVYLEFAFPGGLVQFDAQGNSYDRREHITVFARDVANNGGWISIGDAPHWAWFGANDVAGVGQSGDVQITAFSPTFAFRSDNKLLVNRGYGIFQVGQTVRWVGNQYQITAVDTTTPPPEWASQDYWVTLSGLPNGIAWGQTGGANTDPNMAARPLWDQPQPSVWNLSYSSQAGQLSVQFGPSIYDVEFIGRTRIPRTVTVAMVLPYYGEWEVLVRRSTPVSADPLIANGITWATLRAEAWRSPIAPNVPRTIMEVEVTASEEINGQVQNVSALATSFYWDERIQQMVVSRSPALAYQDLLTGAANRKRIGWDRIDSARIQAWQDWCAAKSPQNDVNATCDMIVDYRTTVAEVAQTICAAGRATPIVVEGLYSIITEEEDRVPVQMLTNRNAREFSTTRTWIDEPEAVKVRYIDETTWERAEVIAFMDGQDANNTTKYDTLDLVGTTRPWQAWRMGRYYLAAARLRKEKMSLTTDVENLVCQRGDLVLVAHDHLLNSAVARVRQVDGSLWTLDADFESSIVSEPFPITEANAGASNQWPSGWGNSGHVNAGVTVAIIGKGTDAQGRGFVDAEVVKAVAAGTTNFFQLFPSSFQRFVNSDDNIVSEWEIENLHMENFVGNTIAMQTQPTTTTGGTGLGSPSITVPFPAEGASVLIQDTRQPGNTLGVVGGWRPSIIISWNATTDYPAVMRLRFFTPRFFLNNRKPDLLQRVVAVRDQLVVNPEGTGANVGGATGNGTNIYPTGWYNAQYTGWTREVVRIDDAWSYKDIDVRVAAPAGTASMSIVFVGNAKLPPSKVVWGSVGVRRISAVGTAPTVNTRFSAKTEAGGFISNSVSAAHTISTNAEFRVEHGPVNYSATANAERFDFAIIFTPAAGVACDAVFRIRLPMVSETVSPTASLPAPPEPAPLYAQLRGSDGVIHDPARVLALPSSDQARITAPPLAAPGDVVAFGQLDQIVTEWLVEGISPGTQLSAQLNLIEYAPLLRDVDDGVIPPYVPPNSESGFLTEFGPVTNITILVSETFEDIFSVNAVQVTWLAPGYAVDHYIIERVLGDGNRTLVANVTDARYTETIPTDGIPKTGTPVEYFITPVTRRGFRGATASGTATVLPDTTAPDAPRLNSNVLGTITRLSWTLPKAPDIRNFEIRWSPDYTTTQWSRMQLVSRTISGTTNTMSTNTRSGLYAIRAVDRSGNYSPVAYTRTIVDVAPEVDTSFTIAGPPWTGVFDRCEVGSDGHLRLSIDPATGLYHREGFFYFDNKFVETKTWGMRAESAVVMRSFPDTADDATGHDAQVILSVTKVLPVLSSPWFTPLAHAIPLAGDPTNKSEWSPLIAEWLDGRIVEGGMWLQSFDGVNTPVVHSATLDLFFDPRTEFGNDVAAPGGVLSVAYRYPFFQPPGLQLTLNAGAPTDYMVRTANTETGFTVEVRAAGGALVTGRRIDWKATGIGISL